MVDVHIHKVFEGIATDSPRSIAVVSERGVLTYQELNDRAECVACFLGNQGVRAGSYVPLCMDRSSEMIVGMLGVLKAGGAYVPIDPAYPRERLRFMLEELDAPVLLTSTDAVDALPETGAAVVCLDRDWTGIERARGQREKVETETRGEGSACVIFTSGSTGTPKGVIVPHRGIVSLVVNSNYVNLGSSDRMAHVSNIGFDAASFEIWGALLNGAQLVIIPKRITCDPRELAAELRRQEITVVFLTTAVFELLATWDGGIFGGIRQVLFGGDIVNAQRVRRVLKSGAAPARLLHLYGPTECATFATSYLVTHVPEDAVTVPIGWPISDTTAYVLDGQRNPVPAGTPGELYLGGPRIASGYLNRPELTRERFPHVSLGEGNRERLYRTGDLVRSLPGGEIEFIGRIDRQIKIRGYRVEPAEIENRLNAHPSVASSVVVAKRDRSGQATLVAFFIADEGRPAPSSAELSAHLALTLPAYMVPSLFVPREEWPLSVHGKLDHDALFESLHGDRQQNEQTPSSASEAVVRKLCSRVIGTHSIDLEESLIAHGLHSLSAANLAWLVEEEFQVRVKLLEILGAPTVRGLLELIERRGHGDAAALPPGPKIRSSRPSFIPLSFPQEQVWFLERLHPHLNSYRFQSLLHCRGALDIGALEATLNQIVSRHEILRTVFLAGDQMPRQEIRPYIPFGLPREDLRALPERLRQRGLDLRIHAELRRPFDTAAGPLIRWRLFQLGDNEFKLLHTEHHFLHDGWGYGIFLGELYATYKALSEKGAPPQSPPIQFADFALWQREVMASGAWDHQLAFWKKELAGCPPPPSLPSDRRMNVPRTFEGLQIRHPFPQAVWQELGRVCSREGVTRFAWIHAAFQLFLHRYTGAEDFCVGSGFANRRDPGLRGMLGMVINTLPIRARFEGVKTFRDLAQRASQALRRVSDNQEFPFERIVQEINPHREANANPFFNTCIGAYEDVFPHFQSERLEITSDDAIACGQVKFDLMALLVPPKRKSVEDSLAKSPAPFVLWEFSTELFDASTGERMLDHFLRLVEGSIREPDGAIERLSLIDKEEEVRILGLGRSSSPPLDDLRVHELFDRVASSSPDSIAVEWENGTISYGDLKDRADALARYLRAQGVEDGVRVGLCMDRSEEMIIGMLGTLKAGGSYVPLDPTYPSQRLDFMTKDAETSLILSIEPFAERVAGIGTRMILLDRDWRLIKASDGGEITGSGSGDDLAYVIFTSGSTGTPKGVAVPHRAIVRLVLDANYVNLSSQDRIAHLSNVCFDAATFEIWGALASGARIVVISKAVALEPRKLAASLRRGKVTTLFLTTALFNEMAAEDGRVFEGIKQVLFGGEAVNAHWVEHVLRSGGAPEQLIHVYGPTECTTFATFYRVNHAPKELSSVPIGRPISNTTCYVLDQHGNPVPIGVPGELYLGGPRLARGYLNRSELTREKFVRHPFSEGEVLYRTGDIVKYLPDGNIEFIRRADSQTKIRGFRIEPGEVEVVLKAHRDVEEAAVVAREDQPGERKLVGYVVSRSEKIVKEWRGYLQERLPSYMIPSTIIRLPALPLTASGKIDRAALPKPERPSRSHGAETALSPVEERIAAIWSEVLGVQDLGPHENFFELGGHSLLATRVNSQLRACFRIEIPLRALFDNPTISELSGFIESARRASQRAPSGLLDGAQREEVLF